MSDELNSRAQKSIDVASTYIQVLIGLASGIITAVLAFYGDISKITNLSLPLLKIALVCFGISIGGGLFGLGGLILRIIPPKKTNPPKSPVEYPADSGAVRGPVIIQLVGFGTGIGLVIFALPS